ncbi:hypothetical protein L1049_024980 [Liquidambar formosana]|uniref:DNA repair protein RAD16 n=1 Tax=Liquidambar formosana TaxID=63359 RepID=A0AAP0RWX0_LIQFO
MYFPAAQTLLHIVSLSLPQKIQTHCKNSLFLPSPPELSREKGLYDQSPNLASMKRRSYRSGSSRPIRARNRQQHKNSSDEEDFVPFLNSDYSNDSDSGEDSLIVMGASKGIDLNVEYSLHDPEYDDCIVNIRKGGLKKKRGRLSDNKEEVRGEEEEENGGTYMEELEVEQHAEVRGVQFVERKQKNEKKRKKNGEERPTLMWEIWEEEHERWIDTNIANDIDLDHQNEIVTETAEASSDLIMPLLRYQKEWLAWALKQEESVTRGGILADEMGMGKTIQAIALVLAKREIFRTIGEFDGSSLSPGSSMGLPKIKCTLVICPVAAVSQWVSEINRFTSEGSTKVLVYHGANRGKSLLQFSKYDFVITTYSIVENEYRKNVMPAKEKCVWCGKLFHPRKMKTHLRYFCGPDAIRTEKQSKQERKGGKHRLKMSNQKTESANDKAGKDYQRKRGPKKTLKRNKKNIDLEIDTGMENSAGDEQDTPTGKSILHSLKWERIILDEAHSIKDRRCNTAKAVFAFESSYKWALSGTPLQNRVGELYSLIRFLQIIPYSHYLCKDCDCRTLDYSATTECSNCAHKSVRHFCWWNKYVATPIQSCGNTGGGRRAMVLLKHKILKSIVLRRTKKGRAADLALPPRIVSLRRDSLDVKEEDYYKSLYNESQAQFNTYVEAGTLMNNYAHIFDLLTRLRQAVDHPYLVVYSKTAAIRSGGMFDTDNSVQLCGICNEPVEDVVVTSCAHVFCKACLLDFSASLGQVSCPSCSKPLTVDLTTNMDPGDQNIKTSIKGFKSSSILNRIRLDDFQTSTKIDALVCDLRNCFILS